jgi:hypothetical protein
MAATVADQREIRKTPELYGAPGANFLAVRLRS